jgi:hypothetical protein
MNNAELARSLEDVREAHRLLSAYYRRILDTASLVADQFPRKTFYQWSPVNTTMPPMRGTNPFDRWGWHFLPLNAASFLFTTAGQGVRPLLGDWMLDIHVSTDSEFTQSDVAKGDPDPRGFAPVESSRSEFALIAWKCVSATPDDLTWMRVWSESYWPDETAMDGKVPFDACLGIQSAMIKCPLEALSSRGEVVKFAEAAKRHFAEILAIEAE